MHVLVVDDDAVFRQELADLLEQDGHTPEVAASVPKAIEMLEGGDFDLVFTDLKMPRHSGLELLEEARRRWPRLLVVMITGYATVDTAVDAMKLGAFDYLRKPFQISHLQKVVALATQELQFQGRSRPAASVREVVRRWLSDGLPVLLISDERVPAQDGLTTMAVPTDPRHVRDAVEAYIAERPEAGVVLHGVDRLFLPLPRGELLRFVAALEERRAGNGRLVVTFDPATLAAPEVEELQALLAGPQTRSTLEALANPIRRAVLRRAADGPVTFTQALEAAGLEDSPKLAFHLRRLVDDGLLGRQDEEYRITQRGRDSIELLGRWDSMAADGLAASAALPRTDA